MIDTGSSESYVSATIVRNYPWTIFPSKNKISMANTQHTSNTQGHCFVNIQFKGTHYDHFKLSVLPNLCADILLGHDFLNLHQKLEIPFDGQKPPVSLCSLTAANVPLPALFGNLSPSCKPVSTKSRRHSHSDEYFIRHEVQKLLQDGIIEPSSSPWRAQVLVTTNENHKKRMVVDYSQTINRFTYLDAYPLPRIDSLIEQVACYGVFSALDLRSAYHQIPIRDDEKPYTAFEACGNLYQFRRIPFGVTNGVACFQRTIDQIITKEKLSATFAYIDNVTICGSDVAEHDLNLSKFIEVARKYGLTFNDDKSIIRTKVIRMLGYEISKGTIKPDPERLQTLRDFPLPTTPKAQQRIVGLFSYYSQWISHFSDKISPLVHNTIFPIPDSVKVSFLNLKTELEKAMLVSVDFSKTFVVETDASDVAIAATLNQDGRPIAFFS